MRGNAILILVLLTLPALVGAAPPAATQIRTVERLVATPTPFGPLTVLADDHVWEVDVDVGRVVVVDALGSPGTLFHFRYHRAGTPEPGLEAPVPSISRPLHGPGTWRVVVDPAGGVANRIDLTFRGFVGDPDGGNPAPFALRDVKGSRPCVVAGACLP